MIQFKNVVSSYDGVTPILKDVSFTIDDGDFVAFVGTNGAGKSTTMRLCNGLLKPDSGEVLIDGMPTTPAHFRAGSARGIFVPEP